MPSWPIAMLMPGVIWCCWWGCYCTISGQTGQRHMRQTQLLSLTKCPACDGLARVIWVLGVWKWLHFFLDSLDKVEGVCLLTSLVFQVEELWETGLSLVPPALHGVWWQHHKLRQLTSETTSILRHQLWPSLELRGSLPAIYSFPEL